MARDPEIIQKEIEKSREQLAASLDALSERANPRRLVDDGKETVVATLDDPKVKYALIAVGAVVALVVLRKLFR